MDACRSRWAERFMMAAIVQGGIACLVGVYFMVIVVFGGPSPARIVASGGAGNWLTVGGIGFGIVGVLGVAVSALFYHYLEVSLQAPYSGWRNLMAWAHLLLGGAGSTAAALLTIYGGYVGGAALLPAQYGGLGENGAYVHEFVLGPLTLPIVAAVAVTLLGFFLGGVGYGTAWLRARRGPSPAGET